jgi:hypothetical protein
MNGRHKCRSPEQQKMLICLSKALKYQQFEMLLGQDTPRL